MTTYTNEFVTCDICKSESIQVILTSTSDFGSPDLDLRPPRLRRSTMKSWIQCCPDCGYVASEIGEAPANLDIVKNVMNSAEWAQPGSIPSSGLALYFLRLALLELKFARPDTAAEAALSAAWVADDSRQTALAIECRLIAARHMTLALTQMEQGGDQRKLLQARLVDVLRRSRRWLDADALCRRAQESEADGIIATILRFQRTLIKRRIVGPRSTDDAQRADTSASM
jgi:hypothetical protein